MTTLRALRNRRDHLLARFVHRKKEHPNALAHLRFHPRPRNRVGLEQVSLPRYPRTTPSHATGQLLKLLGVAVTEFVGVALPSSSSPEDLGRAETDAQALAETNRLIEGLGPRGTCQPLRRVDARAIGRAISTVVGPPFDGEVRDDGHELEIRSRPIGL